MLLIMVKFRSGSVGLVTLALYIEPSEQMIEINTEFGQFSINCLTIQILTRTKLNVSRFSQNYVVILLPLSVVCR